VRIRSVFSHTAQALLEGALIALIVVGLIAGTAFAARGGGGGGHKGGGGGGTTGGGTVALVMAVDGNGDGAANWGDSVTYTVSTSATLYPYVSTTCKQGGTLVLSTSAGFFDGYPFPSATTVPLKTMKWTGGAADCTATLYSNDGGSRTNLAAITFHANA
jgi:hypothetical protein